MTLAEVLQMWRQALDGRRFSAARHPPRRRYSPLWYEELSAAAPAGANEVLGGLSPAAPGHPLHPQWQWPHPASASLSARRPPRSRPAKTSHHRLSRVLYEARCGAARRMLIGRFEIAGEWKKTLVLFAGGSRIRTTRKPAWNIGWRGTEQMLNRRDVL